MSKVFEALVDIQARLNVPKTEAPKDKNAKYRYRSLEQINAAVKPLAFEHQCAILYSDEFQDGRCISTCTLLDAEDRGLSAKAECYVEQNPKYMSKEQACGAASSYARKYAACGLFALDSGEDPDYDNERSRARRDPEPDRPETTALDAAKHELKREIDGWAERNGMDASGAKSGIPKRTGYEENKNNPDWFRAIAQEFRDA